MGWGTVSLPRFPFRWEPSTGRSADAPDSPDPDPPRSVFSLVEESLMQRTLNPTAEEP
ncbi:hypothetical protein HMPREF0682_1148 [Propionibacterium acidifaciens F0233]|uniref:Uncharacterized protein n=1 Tax=Propionibacterium acidifaciens F0233 TaxID=553198 RepID=U2SAN7_9ACTN|nr:hypothetical protein HMPREF0682_1148 [Propionibacterium acidifaciens F0233]